jgi:hypothetical protein
MKSEREEIERRRRDMSRIVWILLPIAIFFFLLSNPLSPANGIGQKGKAARQL